MINFTSSLLIIIFFIGYAYSNDISCLLQGSVKEQQKAYEILLNSSNLPEEAIPLLISNLKKFESLGRSRIDGPDTEANIVTDILIKHGEQSFYYLVKSLSNNNNSIRRYSAFCLGMICEKKAISYLRKAISEEITRAFNNTIKIDDSDFPEMPSTYVLRAMIQAYGRIDSRDAFLWFLRIYNKENNDMNYLANYSLDILVIQPHPIAYGKDAWKNNSDEWMKWWNNNQKNEDINIFHFKCVKLDKEQLDKSPENKYYDIKELFKPFEYRKICEPFVCETDLKGMIDKIANETGIAIKIIAIRSDFKYKFENISMEDALIFVIESENMHYKVENNTIVLSPKK